MHDVHDSIKMSLLLLDPIHFYVLLSIKVHTHMLSVRQLMNHYGNSTNLVKNEYHIGKFRGYAAMMDDK